VLMVGWLEHSRGPVGRLSEWKRKGEYLGQLVNDDWKLISRWGELCPMRFSKAIDKFYILPPAAKSYDRYRDTLIQIAQSEFATLFIPVSGAGSSVEDARAAETMSTATKGKCRTFIQDPITMLDLHDKDRFMALVQKLGFTIPSGQLVENVDQAIEFLKKDGQETKYILKCLGLDENRGDMTLFPLEGDGKGLEKTRRLLSGLITPITKDCPYVFQEFIPGPGTWAFISLSLGGSCPSSDLIKSSRFQDTRSIPFINFYPFSISVQPPHHLLGQPFISPSHLLGLLSTSAPLPA
jgi:hypothetical protein